jgi:HEAT repeat protein
MTFPLVQQARHGEPAKAKAARAELAKIGARAVKPLLDALGDERDSQQKIAIEVLSYVENKSAGPALYNYATGQGDKALRVRAMIACGALRDTALLPKYEAILAPKDDPATMQPNDAVAVAAAWGVARMGDKKAEPLLVRMLATPAPDVRALAALGLGLAHDKKHAGALLALSRSAEVGPTARAAAIHALAELGAGALPSSETVPWLVDVADANEPILRKAALLALGQLAPKEAGAREAASFAIAAGVFSPNEELRRASVAAAAALASRADRAGGEALPVPDGPLTLGDVLSTFGPEAATAAERATALVALAPALEKAAVAAVATSPDRARVVASALLARDDGPSLAPFTDGLEGLDPKLVEGARAAASSIAAAVVPGFVAIERHPDIEVRTRAVELLARRSEPEAQAAVVDALADPDEQVRRAALAAIGAVRAPKTLEAVARVCRESPSWPLRVRAAEALGRLGKGAPAPLVVETLAASARGDAYALVREAAVRALAPLDASKARPLLEDLARTDPEPRVRATAKELLAAKK